MLNSREEQKAKIHGTHKMGEPEDEALAPAGTVRIYSVTKCTLCGASYAEHPAGFFMEDELFDRCPLVENNEPPELSLRELMILRMEEVLSYEYNGSSRWAPVKEFIYTFEKGPLINKHARKQCALTKVSPLSDETKAILARMSNQEILELFQLVVRRSAIQM